MKKQRNALPPQIAARVQRQAEWLKAEGAQRVLVVYEEASVRVYGDVAKDPIPAPRKSA
jgi:hypothetical protein